jgi:drug/metabolite transporter (DMT)-like permease
LKIKNAAFWQNYLPDISLFLSTVIWGLSFTIMKVMLGDQISPFLFVFLRFATATVLLYPLCHKRLPGLGADGLKAGAILGILIYAGFITQAVGITFTTASKSAFITGVSSLFVPVFLVIHRKRLPEPLVIVALLLAGLGMYLLTGPAGGRFNIGDFLTLICAVTFAAQIYGMGLVASKYDTLALTMVEIAATASLAGLSLFFVPIYFVFSWWNVAVLLFITIVGTVLPLLAQAWAQKKTSSVRAGLIFSAEPVFAYIFATILLGETFGSVQKIGGAIIIAAVVSSELIPLVMTRMKKSDSRN